MVQCCYQLLRRNWKNLEETENIFNLWWTLSVSHYVYDTGFSKTNQSKTESPKNSLTGRITRTKNKIKILLFSQFLLHFCLYLFLSLILVFYVLNFCVLWFCFVFFLINPIYSPCCWSYDTTYFTRDAVSDGDTPCSNIYTI